MRDKQRYCCLAAVLALIIGAGFFVLFYTGIFRLASNALLPFVLFSTGGIWLLTLLSVTLAIPRSCALENAYRRCGNMAAAGCGGLMLTALLTALPDCTACLEYELLISICLFFLTLTAGETVCFLYSYHRCQRACRDNCSYTGCRRPEHAGSQCHSRCGCCPQPFYAPRNAGFPRDDGCSNGRFYQPDGSRRETADRSGLNSPCANEWQNGSGCRCGNDCLAGNGYPCGNGCPDLNNRADDNSCGLNGCRHGNGSHGNSFDGYDGNPLCQDKEMF